MKKIDNSVREKVIAMYMDGKSYRDITADTGCARGSITSIVKKANVPLRYSRRRSSIKYCDYCGSSIVIYGAKFCPFCGRNVLTAKEKLIAQSKNLYRFSSLLNSGSRDEYIAPCDTIVAGVKKCEVKE